MVVLASFFVKVYMINFLVVVVASLMRLVMAYCSVVSVVFLVQVFLAVAVSGQSSGLLSARCIISSFM